MDAGLVCLAMFVSSVVAGSPLLGSRVAEEDEGEEASEEALDGMFVRVPEETLGEMPARVSEEAPGEMAEETSEEVPREALGEASGEAPGEMFVRVFERAPEEAPREASDVSRASRAFSPLCAHGCSADAMLVLAKLVPASLLGPELRLVTVRPVVLFACALREQFAIARWLNEMMA